MSSEVTNNGKLNETETRQFIELYGDMVSDSLKINNNSLVNCLDEILLILNNYFILINKNEVEVGTFFQHISPILEAKQSELAEVYERLDKLEEVVKKLKEEYQSLEDRVKNAEKENYVSTGGLISSSLPTDGKFNKLKKFIDSKLSNTNDDTKNDKSSE